MFAISHFLSFFLLSGFEVHFIKEYEKKDIVYVLYAYVYLGTCKDYTATTVG